MESLLKADIFFFVTTVLVIVISAGIVLVIIRILHILDAFERILHTVADGTETLSSDVHAVRAKLKEKGVLTGVILSVISFFMHIKKRSRERTRKQKT